MFSYSVLCNLVSEKSLSTMKYCWNYRIGCWRRAERRWWW